MRVQKLNASNTNKIKSFTDRKLLRVQKPVINIHLFKICFTDRKLLRVQKPQIKLGFCHLLIRNAFSQSESSVSSVPKSVRSSSSISNTFNNIISLL